MPTPASAADSPRSAAARAAREQPVGTPRRGRERALLLFAARPSGPARGNAWSPSSGHASEAVGGSGRGTGCADARGLSGPDVGSAWAERPSSVSICRSCSPRRLSHKARKGRCSRDGGRSHHDRKPISRSHPTHTDCGGWTYVCYPTAQLMDQNVDWFVRQPPRLAGRDPRTRGVLHPKNAGLPMVPPATGCACPFSRRSRAFGPIAHGARRTTARPVSLVARTRGLKVCCKRHVAAPKRGPPSGPHRQVRVPAPEGKQGPRVNRDDGVQAVGAVRLAGGDLQVANLS
jgi:hypothetical protein